MALVVPLALFDGFVFHPVRGLDATPADSGLPYEEVEVRADDGVKLHNWLIPAPGAATLLWLHGNAGTMADRLDQAAVLHRAGISLFMVGYRGYGLSGGHPSEKGLRRDAVACLRELRRRRAGPVVLFGQSLGGGVAIDLASRERVEGLVLEATFTSIADMVREAVGVPLGFLFSSRFESLAKIPRVRAPMLFLHGDRDEVVPLAMGRRLFAAARAPKELHVVAGAGHNDVYVVGAQAYVERVRRFVESIAAPP
ncbi:MAG: alpha/beta hydrolase [Myxococcota bacterium]